MAPPMPHMDCNTSTLAATLTLTAACAGLQRVEAEWQARHEWGGVRVHAMLLDLSGAAQMAFQTGSLCMQAMSDLSGWAQWIANRGLVHTMLLDLRVWPSAFAADALCMQALLVRLSICFSK